MKRVIDGKIFDTETATEICELPCQARTGSFGAHTTWLYKSPGGAYFISGYGGPSSMWGEVTSYGADEGSGLKVIAEQEARAYAERANLDVDFYEDVFGRCAIG